MASKPEKPQALIITHRLIKLGNRTYPLQNIGEVYTDEAKLPRRAKFKNIFWLSCILVVSVVLRNTPDSQAVGNLGVLISLPLTAWQIYMYTRPHTVAVLVFQVHGTSTRVVGSYNRAEIQAAKNAIEEAYHQDSSYSNTVVFNQGQIVNVENLTGDIHGPRK